jgi:DNA polymerase sigma
MVRRQLFSVDPERLAMFEQAGWSQWAMDAAEQERQRRIQESSLEETNERQRRQEWSRKATAAEHQRILREKAISSMEDTPWFQKMTSSYNDDYIVMCPNSHLGCAHSCTRSQIMQHLKSICKYSGERRQLGHAEAEANQDTYMDDPGQWIIMCPYSLFGCAHECKRNMLNEHLSVCTFRGITREEENNIRKRSVVDAVHAAEEERQRRMNEDIDKEGIPMLMRVIHVQRLRFQSVLGREVSKYGQHCQNICKQRNAAYTKAIARVRDIVQKRWANADVHPYGSYASGIMTPDSDIDLVVCMDGDFSWRSSSEQWMAGLAKDLEACSWVSDLKAIDGAMMPVIKLIVECEVECTEQEQEQKQKQKQKQKGAEEVNQKAENQKQKNVLQIPMDITFNGALHYGIASAAFVKQLVKELPSVGPVTQILKKFLGHHGLSDPYTGGLPAYGMVLIVAAIALQLRQQHRNARQVDQLRQQNRQQRSDIDSIESNSNSIDNNNSNNSNTSNPQQHTPLSARTEEEAQGHRDHTLKESLPQVSNDGSAAQTSKLLPEEISSQSLPLSSSSKPPASPLLGPMMSTDDIPSLDGMVPNGLYVTGSKSEVSVKSTPPSPVIHRRRRLSSVGGNGGGNGFWNPASQVDLGTQRGMEIGRPWYLNVMNEDPTTMLPSDEEETLTAVSTTDQALGCLLMDVMHFVSNAFDFERHTLSVMNGGCAYPRQRDSADPMVIEDPLRRVNNVGRSCFRFIELQRICGDALLSLSKSIVRNGYGETENALILKIQKTLALVNDGSSSTDGNSSRSIGVEDAEDVEEVGPN